MKVIVLTDEQYNDYRQRQSKMTFYEWLANVKEAPNVSAFSLRESVIKFAQSMEKELKANDYKGGWKGCDMRYLQSRLTQERKELTNAIKDGNKEQIVSECADVANFAMMISEYDS